MAGFLFLWLYFIVYIYSYYIYFIHSPIKGHNVSVLLQIMLQWTRGYRHLFQLVFPFSSDKDPEVDHMAIFNFLRNLHTVLYSNLAREIPWTEEPGRLQSTGSQKIGHYWSNLACKCTPIYVPTNSAQGFPFFYILTNIISHPFDNRHSLLKYNFIYLFFGCAGSSLLHGLFFNWSEQEVLSRCGEQASHCGGFSCYGDGL